MTRRHLLYACLGLSIPLVPLAVDAADHVYGTPTGCLVILGTPLKSEQSLRWTGKCADEYATGPGTLFIVDERKGEPERQLRGSMKRGVIELARLGDAPPAPEAEQAPATEALNLRALAIYFDTRSTDLSEAAKQTLKQNAPHFRAAAQAGRQITITGHTDHRGDKAANQALSEKRAETVLAYLVSLGVQGGKLRAQGVADTLPADPQRFAGSAHRANRRVTFDLTGN